MFLRNKTQEDNLFQPMEEQKLTDFFSAYSLAGASKFADAAPKGIIAFSSNMLLDVKKCHEQKATVFYDKDFIPQLIHVANQLGIMVVINTGRLDPRDVSKEIVENSPAYLSIQAVLKRLGEEKLSYVFYAKPGYKHTVLEWLRRKYFNGLARAEGERRICLVDSKSNLLSCAYFRLNTHKMEYRGFSTILFTKKDNSSYRLIEEFLLSQPAFLKYTSQPQAHQLFSKNKNSLHSKKRTHSDVFKSAKEKARPKKGMRFSEEKEVVIIEAGISTSSMDLLANTALQIQPASVPMSIEQDNKAYKFKP